MGKVLAEIGPREEAFITSSKVFFVATAPASTDQGRVNVSPKSPGSSAVVLNPNRIAYADLTGSGSETAAHVVQNGRITILFVNLETGPPKILRLYGRGSIVRPDNVDQELLRRFPKSITSSYGFRAVVYVDVDRISTSCGYSMPIMTFVKYRSTLEEYTEKKGCEGMRRYRVLKNSFSIDGLPSLSLLFRRPNDPPIEPIHEEGYVYGAEKTSTASGGDGDGDGDDTGERRDGSRWTTRWRGQIRTGGGASALLGEMNLISKSNTCAFGALMFAAGALVGSMCWRKARLP